MKCPVCPAHDIPNDSLSCPVCGTDMAALQRVRQIHLAVYNEAVRLAESGAIDLALEHALSSLAMDERFVPGMVLAGQLLWRKKRFSEAMERWRQAVRFAPEDREALKLIASGDAYLKRRRRVRSLAAGGVAAMVLMAVLMLPTGSFQPGDGGTTYLDARVAALEDMWGQEEASALPAHLRDLLPPPEDLSDLAARVVALEHAWSQKDLQRIPPSPSEVARQVADPPALPASAVTGDVTREDLSELAHELRALSKQQTAIASGMESLGSILGGLAATVEDMQRDRSEQAAVAAARMSSVRAAVDGIVESLRPARMQDLQDAIAATEEKLQRYMLSEQHLRGGSDLVRVLRHRVARSKVRECEANLCVLREEWTSVVVPWMELRKRTDAAFSQMDQGGER